MLAISSTGELALSLGRHSIFGFETVGTLARVPLAGGAPRELLENVEDADWSPDGASLAITREVGNRGRVEYPIGKVVYDNAGWVNHVRVSPDGRLVAFVDHPQKGDSNGNVKVVDLAGKVILTGPYSNGRIAWSSRGDEVWSGDRTGIMATRLSGKSRRVWLTPGGDVADIARDGRVLTSLGSSRREIVGLAKGEKEERNLTWLNWSFPSDISPDGKTLLFTEQNVEPPAVYLRKLDGSPAVKLGTGGAVAYSPDGQWILATPDVEGTQFELLPAGAGEPKVLPKTGLSCQSGGWLPDGRRFLASCNEPGHGYRIYLNDVSGAKPRPITPEGVNFIFPGIAPDGKSFTATGPDRRIAIYPVEPGEPHPVAGIEPNDIVLRWSSDGKGILVYRPSAPPLRVEIVDFKTGQRTLWKELRPPDPSGVEQVGPIVMAPDESSYVYSYRRLLEDLYLATGLK